MFLCLLFIFLRFLPKIPGAIILSPIGILLGYLSVEKIIPINLLTLGGKYPDMSGKLFIAPTLYWDWSLIIAAFSIALVAILETMISAKIADGMTKTKHHKRKEMLGLGLANIASGAFGGIPATAALARTSLNIKSGATDKLSALISSITIALISFIFLRYFSYIPLSVIAAILVFTAIRMVEINHFISFFKHDKQSLILALFVALVTIIEDPIVGILVGTALSLLLFMEKLSHGYFDLIANQQQKGIIGKLSGRSISSSFKDADTLLYSIKGNLTYINAQSHLSRFESGLSKYKNIILRLRELTFIDIDGIEALDEIIETIESKKARVALTGINPLIEVQINNLSLQFKKLKMKGLIFEKTEQALFYFGYKK